MPDKQCKKCNQLLQLSQFGKNSSNKDGLMTRCKACLTQMNHEKRGMAESTRLKLEGKKRCRECKEIKSIAEDFYLSNKEKGWVCSYCKNCLKDSLQDWRADNQEHLKEYAQDNRGRINEQARQRRQNLRLTNPELLRERDRKQASTPSVRERNRRNAKVQKAKRRGAPYTPEALEYIEILKGDPCVYCGKHYETTEHIVAVSKGGTGDWDNLASACGSCNSSKWKKDLLDFMLYRIGL